MDLNMGLRRSFTHIFIVVDVNTAILDTDFLQAFGLVVDMTGQYLREPDTQLATCGVVKAGTSVGPQVAHANQGDAFLRLLKEYPSISLPSFHKEEHTT